MTSVTADHWRNVTRIGIMWQLAAAGAPGMATATILIRYVVSSRADVTVTVCL